jgi:hypothetical protein
MSGLCGLPRLHYAFNKRAYELSTRGSDWARLFRELDRNHDESLTPAEIEYAARVTLGLTVGDVTDSDITDFITRFDMNGDGKLCLKEVSRFLQLPFHLVTADTDPSDHPTPREDVASQHAGPREANSVTPDLPSTKQVTAPAMVPLVPGAADADAANEAFLVRFGAIVGGAGHEERLIKSMEKLLRDYASARQRLHRHGSVTAEAAAARVDAACIADLVRAAKGGVGLSEVDSEELVLACIRCTHPGVPDIERSELECVHAATLWIGRLAQLSQARQDELSEHGAVSALIERAHRPARKRTCTLRCEGAALCPSPSMIRP